MDVRCKMGWATPYIERLRQGETVSFRVVLCKVNGREYLHLVKAIQGARFQIGNNRGRINGWVSAGAIFGKCVRVEA